MTIIKGIAGADIRTGQMLIRGADGKYYPAVAPCHHLGVVAEDVRKGETIESRDDGPWRKVNDMELFAGKFDSVARLEQRLTEAGFIRDLHGNWRRGDLVVSVEGSRINGFYAAELRK